jgi:hypothetical protein
MNSLCLPTLVALVCLHAAQAVAALPEDYRLVEERRVKIERADRERVARREQCERANAEISRRWSECAGGRWSAVWQPFERRLDDARKELEKQRVDVFKLKEEILRKAASLEKRRRSIERNHSGNRGAEYEDEFRDYMSDLEIEYFLPFEENYLPAADAYLSAVEAWQASASDALRACRQGDISAPVVETALKNIATVIELVLGIGRLLKKG